MVFFEKYKYPIIGGILGLVLAILLMTFGFFKTLIAIIFIALGVYGGLFVKRTGILDNYINRR
ncbi:DUF2273 domain-containing protein [Streptococcus hongkongensis]